MTKVHDEECIKLHQSNKEKVWIGYYSEALEKSRELKTTAAEYLDMNWGVSARRQAEKYILPHVEKNHIVLEIGCGIGRVGRFVAPHCESLICTDIIDEALREAKKYLADHQNIDYQKISGYDLAGFKSDSFDVIYALGTFIHLDFELVVHYFSEIKRVLKRRGRCILEFKKFTRREALEPLLERIKEEGIERVEADDHGKFRYVSLDMLKVLCEYYDLNIIDGELHRFTFEKSDRIV